MISPICPWCDTVSEFVRHYGLCEPCWEVLGKEEQALIDKYGTITLVYVGEEAGNDG